MATMQHYNAGLDELRDWTTATYRWALLSAGTFRAGDDTMAAALVGATEISAAGYARVDVSSPVRTVDDTGARINYGAASPDFGTLAAGETVAAVVLFRFVTNDAGSTPIGWWTLSPAVATDATDPLVFSLTAGLVAYQDAA